MAKLLAVLAAMLEALRPYMPAIAGYLAGIKAEQNAQTKEDLRAVVEAGKARDDVRRLSHDERLQYLRERGLLRDIQADNGK